MSKQFSIVVCGSPRVGKSSLIKALCESQSIPTSDSLNPHTNQIERYVLKRTSLIENDSTEYAINIYDTPGLESWNDDDVRPYFTKLMTESQPICMIYCASPGSFARLDHLRWLIDTCIQSNIFCALVRTNKYSGNPQQRRQILDEFHYPLSEYHDRIRVENNIKFYSNVALCASVNSVLFEDADNSIVKHVEGIHELIFGILKSLNNEKATGWIYAISENESFWSTMLEQISAYFNIPISSLQQTVKETIEKILFKF